MYSAQAQEEGEGPTAFRAAEKRYQLHRDAVLKNKWVGECFVCSTCGGPQGCIARTQLDHPVQEGASTARWLCSPPHRHQ